VATIFERATTAAFFWSGVSEALVKSSRQGIGKVKSGSMQKLREANLSSKSSGVRGRHNGAHVTSNVEIASA
jgi:hypothetical protein